MQHTNAIRVFMSFMQRNNHIYGDPERRITPNKVNLHWWKLPGEQQNVGDYLSVIIVDYLKKMYSLDDSNELKRTKHLYAIGSIIDGGYQDAVVWGSGILRGNRMFWWRKVRKLDIRAVRGPNTRQTLLKNGYHCPEIYGDPAILIPLFYSPKSVKKVYDYRVVQHHSISCDMDNMLSPVTNDWMNFIDELVKCKLVISSSLHGLILAEAYGISAVLLASNVDLFKFKDYYHSTGGTTSLLLALLKKLSICSLLHYQIFRKCKKTC